MLKDLTKQIPRTPNDTNFMITVFIALLFAFFGALSLLLLLLFPTRFVVFARLHRLSILRVFLVVEIVRLFSLLFLRPSFI